MQEADLYKEYSSCRQKFVDWFYLPEGLTSIVRRLTAFCLILSLAWIWYWGKGGPGPYLIPTWRFGNHFLNLPSIGEPFHSAIFLGMVLCCLYLIFGGRRKIFIVFPTLVITYYACLDREVALPHFVVIIYIFLVALCFHRQDGPSLTRRIIQIGVATCYGVACLYRILTPEYLSGESFRFTIGTGWAVNSFFKECSGYLNSQDWFWAPFALGVLLVELFLTFALFNSRTRKIALVTGLFLHAGIAITMKPRLIIFSLIMLTGYLAFVERKNESKKSPLKVNKWEFSASLIFMIFMLVIPLRTLFWSGKDTSTITMFDRHPWSFHMFLYKMDVEKVSVKFQTKSGDWRIVPVLGRMKNASSDSDMLSLINYLFEKYPEAETVSINFVIKQNRWTIYKDAQVKRGSVSKLTINSSSKSY